MYIWFFKQTTLGRGWLVYINYYISISGYSYLEKQALRYGFQETKECKDFAKAYICVQKCLDFNYDVAHSDKFCKCTCFMKLNKEKFTFPPVTNGTKWSAGAPTTTIFVTPKFPPTFEDDLETSQPEYNNDESDDKDDDKVDDKGGSKGGDKGGNNEGDKNRAGELGDDSSNLGSNETSGSNPKGDGLITSADGEDSKSDGNVEGGGIVSAAEGGGEPTAEGGGVEDEDKPAT